MSKSRYNLTISTSDYNNLQKIAEQEETTTAELLRRAIKMLLFIHSIKEDPDARLLVKRGDDIQEIVLDLV